MKDPTSPTAVIVGFQNMPAFFVPAPLQPEVSGAWWTRDGASVRPSAPIAVDGDDPGLTTQDTPVRHAKVANVAWTQRWGIRIRRSSSRRSKGQGRVGGANRDGETFREDA